MDNSNVCPECGGTASHLVTDIDGSRYYRCVTGLTTFESNGGEVTRASRIVPCDTILNENRRPHTGTIAFVSDGKVKTLAVTNGKERR